MEITINVNESQFNEVLKKELEAFDKEELKNIIREGLIKCISDSKQFEGLFVREIGRYDYKRMCATDILIEAAKTINISPVFEEFEQKARQWIMDNHADILRDILTDLLLQGISNKIFSSDFSHNFRNQLFYELSQK